MSQHSISSPNLLYAGRSATTCRTKSPANTSATPKLKPRRYSLRHARPPTAAVSFLKRDLRPALLNLKQYFVDVRAFEIRILASSIEKQFVLDAFMQI